MIVDFKNLRPSADYPTYPPYHKGDYLEGYFYKFYLKNKERFDKTEYTLIPIFWTNVYLLEKNIELIEPYLAALPEGKYFTVSQYDDGVKVNLPYNALSFDAGGRIIDNFINCPNNEALPIPLICSPLECDKTEVKKDIFCSFVGSDTHPIRQRVKMFFGNDPEFNLTNRQWRPDVPQDQLDYFIDITKRSNFSLAPRGHGAQSFRFYEIIQLNSIPVILYDREWLPFNDMIDYDSFCIRVQENEIHNLKNILKNISEEKQQEMLKKGKEVYEKYFTMEGLCEGILKTLENKSTSFDNCMKYSSEYLTKPAQVPIWDNIKRVYNNFLNNNKSENIIPKIIHQIWLGDDIPDIEKKRCDNIKAFCNKEGWEYKLWGNDDVESLGNFKNKDLFDKTPNYGQKSDILRNVILYEYGGIYLDTDFILKKTFDDLLSLDFFCGLCYDEWPSMSNSIMGSKPKSDTITLMQTYDRELSWKDGMSIIDSTGPYHTTRKVIETLSDQVVVFPNSYFYPYPCFNRHRVLGNNPELYVQDSTYCIHLWAETWNR